MNDKDAISTSVITGTGEFERKNFQALSTVVIHNGIIQSVDFVLRPDNLPEEVRDMARKLVGKQVTRILEFDSRAWDDITGDTSNIPAFEVLLEAFHRAVETCLDR